MAKYLDENGLLYVWSKIKTLLGNKVDKVSGKGLSTNDYTTAEKNKLAGIAAGAEVNQNAFSNVKVGSTTIAADNKTDVLELVAGSNVTLTPDATNDKVTIAARDTTYNAFTGATDTTDGKSGLVPAPLKAKKNGFLLGSGKWGVIYPKIKTTDRAAHIYLVDYEASPDGSEYISEDIFPTVTSDRVGLMLAADKDRLDHMEDGANNYKHPSYTAKASGLYKVTIDNQGHVSATAAVSKTDITGLGIPAQDTTYSDMTGATSSTAGTHGLVPAPAAGKQTQYLRGDGTWATPTDTKYTHPTGDGNKHVPATGTTNNGKFLMAGSTAGALSWGTPTDTKYNDFAGATSSADGTHGLVPAPAAWGGVKLLGSNGKWMKIDLETLPSPTYAKIRINDGGGGWYSETNVPVATESIGGLMSAADKSKLKNIDDDANNYEHPSYTAKASGLYKVTVDNTGHVSAATAVTKYDITSLGIPGQDTNTTYNDFTGATATFPGTHGLVPLPKTGENTTVLCGNGNWKTPVFEQATESDNSIIKQIGLRLTVGDYSKAVYIPNISSTGPGLMTTELFKKLQDLPTVTNLESIYAKKADIVGMYKYKGSVATASDLPTTGQKAGDVYNIETASPEYGGAGMNVAWDGSKWDPLGEIFTITSITNTEIDAICK